MEHITTTCSSARLAMAAEFKRQPGHAPIDPRRENSAMPSAHDFCQGYVIDHSDRPLPWQRQFLEAVETLGSAQSRAPIDPVTAISEAMNVLPRVDIVVVRNSKLATALLDFAQRGPTLGRKRRRRRARGRARERH